MVNFDVVTGENVIQNGLKLLKIHARYQYLAVLG